MSTPSQPSSIAIAASDAVPTPASTMIGTLAFSMISSRLYLFWMPRPEPIGAASGMALVDRNVIRIALFELAHCPTVPVNVVLNEAVELAKRYGTAEGAAFANGLLDRALTDLNLRR